MWLNKTDNSIIKKPKAITVGGVQHPSSIFSKWGEVELNAINIFTITEDKIPNRRYYTCVDELDTVTAHITRTPIEKSLVDVQDLMLKDLESTANSKFGQTTSGYTPSEMSSWAEMEADALAHQTIPLTSGMLYDEAIISGISVDALATKVLYNAEALKQAKSYIAGTRKRKSVEIMTLVSVDECILYEATPSTRPATQEDVDLDVTLTIGDAIPITINKVTEW